MKYMTELTFIIWSLLYSAIVLGLLILSHSYWTIMFISFIVFIGFDLIRPDLRTTTLTLQVIDKVLQVD